MLSDSDWQEFKGFTSIHSIKCPHCGTVVEVSRPDPERAGLLGCFVCLGTMILRVVLTPLGLAWQTWDRDPSTPSTPTPERSTAP